LLAAVLGHRSELAFGKVGDVPVVAMLGRVWLLVFFAVTAADTDTIQFHAYEGHSLDTVVYPIRLMAALGVKDMISASHPFADFPALLKTDG
jgi:purine-nucleoside phosphorylase